MSTSVDGTLKVWAPERSSEKFLLNPFYVNTRTLTINSNNPSNFPAPLIPSINNNKASSASLNMNNSKQKDSSANANANAASSASSSWFTCSAVRTGEDWAFYTGDSEGSIAMYQMTNAPHPLEHGKKRTQTKRQ
jgi:hypothetical protein